MQFSCLAAASRQGLVEDVGAFLRDERWGTARCGRSLHDILGEKEANKWMSKAVKARRMQDEPNRLKREWLNPERVPTEEEIKRILDHVAKAQFSTRVVPVDRRIVGQVFQGKRLAKNEPSILAHLAKRVLVERQWVDNVTPDEYVAHLRTAVLDAEARKVIYIGKDGRLYAGFLAINKLPAKLLADGSQDFVWVVYAADYGTIVTGYQVSGLEKINLPPDVRWL